MPDFNYDWDSIRPNIEEEEFFMAQLLYDEKNRKLIPTSRLIIDEVQSIAETKKPLPASQRQAGGTHYKNLKIQPGYYCQVNNLPFFESNVVKYVTRHREKGKAKDIKKAIHMLEFLLEVEYNDVYNREDID